MISTARFGVVCIQPEIPTQNVFHESLNGKFSLDINLLNENTLFQKNAIGHIYNMRSINKVMLSCCHQNSFNIPIRFKLVLVVLSLLACMPNNNGVDLAEPILAKHAINSKEHIVIIGNGFGERMGYFPYFETLLHQNFPQSDLVIRNLSRSGDTAGFRPHPARVSQWAFPGAEKFHPDLQAHIGVGHYPTPDQWLTQLQADTILSFFGYNESFNGDEGIADFTKEIDTFVTHTLAQKYGNKAAPQLVLISPIAFEDLSSEQDLPNGKKENRQISAYTEVMRQIAKARNIGFIDLFTPTKELYATIDKPMTINGFSLSDSGYQKIAKLLIKNLYGENRDLPVNTKLYQAVQDKNWYWTNDHRMLNGVHVYGQRHEPHGSENYPEEIEKLRQITHLRDEHIHAIAKGHIGNAVDDRQTRKLSTIKSDFYRPIKYLDVDKAIEHFTLPDGFEIDLFASELEFPDLTNPVQMSFDNKGRLWVAVAPSYPHYKPGDSRPDDKLLILEDTDNDGRADKQIIFARGLHLPIGFELAPEGVYLAQQPNLVLLVDDDGDDHADRQELLLHGFDTHDSHHAISAFGTDASGAIYLNEGRFLHSQVETPYGPQRAVDGGVWRFNPRNWRLERFMQTDLNNPWGIAFDQWDQAFLSDASDGYNFWSLPLSAKSPYGYEIKKTGQFTTHGVRPTAGTEFVSSGHFPEEMQGDFMINNVIGFLGTKQHRVVEEGAGYTGELRHDLVYSSDPNYRPVDMEFAADGSLYITDWHNAVIAHAGKSARDPNRDHDHGRIYRITYPSRPLISQPKIVGASIPALLDNLKLDEYRARYRTRRELRGRDTEKVLSAVKTWADALDTHNPNYERYLLEALWLTWAKNGVDVDLLKQTLQAKSHQARSAAVHVLRYTYRQVNDAQLLLIKAANDPHPRVRLEAIVAASWLDGSQETNGALIAIEGLKHPITHWMGRTYEAVLESLDEDIQTLIEADRQIPEHNPALTAYLNGELVLYKEETEDKSTPEPWVNLSKEGVELYQLGAEVYRRDAHCQTCHGEDANGAVENVYPPLRATQWINGDSERLIKIVLKGLWGPIEVKGKVYDPNKGVPPMTAFASLLNDREIAAVLTYVRIKFGEDKYSMNQAITPNQVKNIRQKIEHKKDFYRTSELLKEHPLTK